MSVANFFRWWGRELGSLVPGHSGSARTRGQTLCFDVGPTEIVARHVDAGGARELGRVPRAAPGPAREALVATVHGLRPEDTACEVRLDAQLALQKSVTLPAAAEENLRQVLGFEMERQTPFRAEEVYFDHLVMERDRSARQVTLTLAVAPRLVVDEALDLVSDWALEQEVGGAQLGVPAERPDSTPTMTLRFLPAGFRRGTGGTIALLLVVVNLALAAAVVAVPMMQQKSHLDELATELAAVRTRATAVGALRQSVEDKRAQLGQIMAIREGRPSMVELLEELSALVPDDTWLMRLEIKGDRVNLAGQFSRGVVANRHLGGV